MPSKHEHHITTGPFNRCKVCGQPKGDREIWSVDLEFFEHEECRDWSKTSFPLDGKLLTIREVALTARALFDTAVALGLELKAARDKWPDNALVLDFTERAHPFSTNGTTRVSLPG